MVNRVSSYFPKGGHSATQTELNDCHRIKHNVNISIDNYNEKSRNVIAISSFIHYKPGETLGCHSNKNRKGPDIQPLQKLI